MRAALRIAVAAGALAALVAALTATPIGWRVASSALSAAARGRGLELRIGSLHGNLLRRAVFEGVEFSEPGGPAIARIDTLRAEYSLAALAHRRVVVPKLRVSGAELLFVRGRDGSLVGWSRLAGERRAAPAGERPAEWTVDAAVEVSGLRATVRDSAGSYDLVLSDVRARARGGLREFEAAVEGSLTARAASLAEPVSGTFDATASGADGTVTVGRASVTTGPGAVTARGAVSPRALDLAFEASADLAALGRAVGRAGLGGALEAAGTVVGAPDSASWRATVEGRDLTLASAAVASLDARLAGAGRKVEFDLRAREVDLAALATPGVASPEAPPALSGLLDVSATGRADSLSVAGVTASFEASVARLGAAGRDLGPAEVRGTLRGGRFEVAGECLAVALVASGALGERGPAGPVSVSASTEDLSVASTALGATGVRGRGSVTALVADLVPPPGAEADPFVTADASFSSLAIGGIETGPVVGRVAGRLASLAVGAEAFGGSVAAEGTVGRDGSYALAVAADGLALSWSPPDTAGGIPPVSVAVTADAVVRGSAAGGFAAEGTVDAASVLLGAESLALARPAAFSAGRDSLNLTGFVFSGALGQVAVGGTLDAGGENDLVLRLTEFDLGRAAALVPGAGRARLGGVAEGAVTVVGSGRARRLAADVVVRGLSAGGLLLDTVAVAAESDSEDLSFEVEGLSPHGGTMTAYGTVPVRPDSTTVLVLDPGREFGATVAWSGFALAGGPELLPQVAGRKRFVLDGSVLLAGTVDSLSTLYGRGRFDSLDVSFERVGFSLSSPLDVEVAGGDVEVPGAGIVATRRRALGDPESGTVWLSGEVARDGRLALALSLERLDVGGLIAAFAPGASRAFEGRLDGRAALAGTLREPAGEFSWDVGSPVVYGVGFDRMTGSARLERGEVVLDRVELRAPGGSIVATGTVPLPAAADPGSGARPDTAAGAPAADGGPPEPGLDLRISVASLDLHRLADLPDGVLEARGILTADVAATGALNSPSLSGPVALRGGSVRLAALSRPIEDITVDAALDGGTVVLREAAASLGRGRVLASGFAEPLGPGEHPFWLSVKLDSPEVSVPRSLSARFGGELRWAGTGAGSRLSGDVVVERMDVTQQIGLGDILAAGPVRSIRPRAGDPRARVALDVGVSVRDRIGVRSNLADLDLEGGVQVGGTLLAPRISGGVYAEGGSFRYLDNEFALENLNVSFVDPRRQDPFVDLAGTADVESRSGESYAVTLRVTGFAFDAVPALTSEPPLSEPDVLALLTLGDTVGGLAAGGAATGSSGQSWAALTRQAFLGSLFGVAEGTMERLLNLDRVEVDRDDLADGDLSGAGVTLGKRFGDRLRVDYRTSFGRFEEREVDVALRLTRYLSLETRADQEGNHAVGFRVSLLFE